MRAVISAIALVLASAPAFAQEEDGLAMGTLIEEGVKVTEAQAKAAKAVEDFDKKVAKAEAEKIAAIPTMKLVPAFKAECGEANKWKKEDPVQYAKYNDCLARQSAMRPDFENDKAANEALIAQGVPKAELSTTDPQAIKASINKRRDALVRAFKDAQTKVQLWRSRLRLQSALGALQPCLQAKEMTGMTDEQLAQALKICFDQAAPKPALDANKSGRGTDFFGTDQQSKLTKPPPTDDGQIRKVMQKKVVVPPPPTLGPARCTLWEWFVDAKRCDPRVKPTVVLAVRG